MWSKKTKGEDFILDLSSVIGKFQKEREDLIKGHTTLLKTIKELDEQVLQLRTENKMLRSDLLFINKEFFNRVP